VNQPENEHEVRPGYQLHVLACAVLGELGSGAEPRVDNDQPAALSYAPEVLDCRRHRVCQVAAEQHDGVGVVEVGQRERQAAIDAKRTVRGSGRR
jgi:hypothetical protein